MAYVHQVSFDLAPEDVDELRTGAGVQRVLSYLKSLLPSYPGFISARGMQSITQRPEGGTRVIFESTWQTWDDVLAHDRSSIAEEQVLREFEPRVNLNNVQVRLLHEIM